jgi:hypothetical protein
MSTALLLNERVPDPVVRARDPSGEKYRALLGSVKRLSQKIAEGVEARIEVAGR